MPEQLTFTSVELDKLGRNDKGAWGTFSSSLNNPTIKKMGWTEIPECLTGSDLEGEIAAISLEIKPNDGGKGIELELARMVSFKTVRRELEGKKDKGHRTELRFKVIAQDMKGARKLEEYKMSNLGKSKLIVSFERQPKQEELPGTQPIECSSCQDEIPMSPDKPRHHVNGSKCTAEPVQEHLPS